MYKLVITKSKVIHVHNEGIHGQLIARADEVITVSVLAPKALLQL